MITWYDSSARYWLMKRCLPGTMVIEEDIDSAYGLAQSDMSTSILFEAKSTMREILLSNTSIKCRIN
jgi:hypothetical protein